MYSVRGSEGNDKQSRTIRGALAFSYFLMAAGGAMLLVSPIWKAEGLTATCMAAFLLVGGALALFGAITHKWVGEFTGLPLLISAFGVFAILNFTQGGFDAAPWLVTANGCILVSVSCLIVARWRVSVSFYRLSTHPSVKQEG